MFACILRSIEWGSHCCLRIETISLFKTLVMRTLRDIGSKGEDLKIAFDSAI